MWVRDLLHVLCRGLVVPCRSPDVLCRPALVPFHSADGDWRRPPLCCCSVHVIRGRFREVLHISLFICFECVLLWRQELRPSRHLASPSRLSACWRRLGLEHMCTASYVRACWRQELRPSRHLTSPSRLSACWRRLGLAWSA